jgi:hypothetical protein
VGSPVRGVAAVSRIDGKNARISPAG